MTKARKIAVAGDRFMRPDFFSEALSRRAAESGGNLTLDIRVLESPWPDAPMTLSDPRFPEIREFIGEPDEVADFIGDAEVLVNHLAPVTSEMLEKLPMLKLIAVARGGPVNIDAAAAARRGIPIVQAPGRNASAVAEFTIGAILCETRRIRAGHESLRRGEWRGDLYRADITGDELCDLTVGIVGYGQVGKLLAKLLLPFECRLLVADPCAKAEEGVARNVSLDELLRESDIVALNARVTPETTGMMSRARIAMMRPGAILVNAARGPLVDYNALLEALTEGKIGGAVLDTFPAEPPSPDWQLLRLPNVTLTPHIAGASRRTIRRAADMIAGQVVRRLTENRTSES